MTATPPGMTTLIGVEMGAITVIGDRQLDLVA